MGGSINAGIGTFAVRTPVFTVVIPVYNREDSVARSIDSVLRQTTDGFEVVVVDDGSTDGTPAILAQYSDPRVRTIRQENAGVSAARNAGAALANGQYLLFLDSDDFAEPDWLASFQVLHAESPFLLAFCGSRYLSSEGRFLYEVLPRPMGPLFGGITGQNLPGGWAVSREAYHAAGGYDNAIGFSANSEVVMRLAAYCLELGFVPPVIERCLVTMEHRGERSVDGWKLADAEWFLEKYGHRFREHPGEWSQWVGSWGGSAARLGRYSLARRYFWRAVALAPLRGVNWLRWGLTWVPWMRGKVWDINRAYSLRDRLR